MTAVILHKVSSVSFCSIFNSIVSQEVKKLLRCNLPIQVTVNSLEGHMRLELVDCRQDLALALNLFFAFCHSEQKFFQKAL